MLAEQCTHVRLDHVVTEKSCYSVEPCPMRVCLTARRPRLTARRPRLTARRPRLPAPLLCDFNVVISACPQRAAVVMCEEEPWFALRAANHSPHKHCFCFPQEIRTVSLSLFCHAFVAVVWSSLPEATSDSGLVCNQRSIVPEASGRRKSEDSVHATQ